MSLNGTYAGLVASVGDFLNRADLSATIPDFIVLAEADLARKMLVRQALTSLTINPSSEFLALPSDFEGIETVVGSTGIELNQRDPAAMITAKYVGGSGSGTTTDVAVVGSNLQFYPAPTASTAMTLLYYARLPALATNQSGNWLSLKYPDAYLYGALTAAAPYLQDDARLQVWSGLYLEAVSSIKKHDRSRYGAALTPQPSVTQII